MRAYGSDYQAYDDGKYGHKDHVSNDASLNERYRWEEGYKERQERNKPWEPNPSSSSSSSSPNWGSYSGSGSDGAAGGGLGAILILIVIAEGIYKFFASLDYLALLISVLKFSACAALVFVAFMIFQRWSKNLPYIPKIYSRKNDADYDLKKEGVKSDVFLKRMIVAFLFVDLLITFFMNRSMRLQGFFIFVGAFSVLGGRV